MVFAEILEFIAMLAINTISFFGYFGIFMLMLLESTTVPIPSELVMPFAGYLAHEGKFNFWIVVLVGGWGGIAGSLLSYYMGKIGGRPFIMKFGKFLLIEESDLEWTENWFRKHGEKTIFISRFIPVVRHLISVPAGIAKMDVKRFVFYTFLGATAWSFILTYAGYYLGSRWDEVHHVTRNFSFVIVLIIIAIGIWYVWRHLKRKR